MASGKNEKIDTGKLKRKGEALLRDLASDFAVNPSNENDLFGWDFILEAGKAKTDRTLSTGDIFYRPPEHKVFVQVKATVRGERIQVLLQHWERFAKQEIPTFFMIAVYSKAYEIREVFIVHVGKDEVERVAERIVRLKPNQKDTYNKTKLELKWSPSHRLQEVTDRAFREMIEGHLVLSPTAYGVQKRMWYQNAGVEKSLLMFQVASNDDSVMKNALLGYLPNLEVENMRVIEQRFGQEIVKEVLGNQKISLEPSATDTWEAINLRTSHRTRVKLDFHTTFPLAKWMNESDHEIRWTNGVLDINLTASDQDLRIQFCKPDITKPIRLASLVESAKVFRIMSEAVKNSHDLRLENVSAAHDGKIVKYDIRVSAAPPIDRWLSHLLEASRYLDAICKKLCLDSDFTVDTISLLEQYRTILFAVALTAPESLNSPVALSLPRENAKDMPPEIAIPVVSVIRLIKRSIIVAGIFHGKRDALEREDADYVRLQVEPRLIGREIFDNGAPLSSDVVGQHAKEVEKWCCTNRVEVIRIGTFVSYDGARLRNLLFEVDSVLNFDNSQTD